MRKTRENRKSCVVEEIIQSFQKKVKDGPNYVCCACHRMMYRATVVELKVEKYTKSPSELIDDVLSYRLKSQNGTEWICKTCHETLKRGKMPAQAKANNLYLAPQPKELKDLNPLELRLLSQRIPFMKMIGLPRGKQHGIHGPAVNVPSNVDEACSALPRLPTESLLIPLKFKRKREYKKHYYYKYVDINKVFSALRYLKKNNHLYRNIKTVDNWTERAASDDKELWKALTKQEDEDDEIAGDDAKNDKPEDVSGSVSETPAKHDENVANQAKSVWNEKRGTHTTSKTQTKCKRRTTKNANIQKNPQVAKAMHDSKETRTKTTGYMIEVIPAGTGYYGTLETIASRLNMKIVDVANDGNCLFASVCYLLEESSGSKMTAMELRRKLALYMEENPDDYKHFVCARVESADRTNADTEQPDAGDRVIALVDDEATRTEMQWLRYLEGLENGTQWGEHISLQAMADMLSLRIQVHSTTTDVVAEAVGRHGVLLEIHLGLIAQAHYVALTDEPSHDLVSGRPIAERSVPEATDGHDNIHVPEYDVMNEEISQKVHSHSSTNVDHKSDDGEGTKDGNSDTESMAEDEAYSEEMAGIRGLPYETVMLNENPELSDMSKVFSVAPAEGQKPIAMLSENFEELSNPDKYPDGKNGLTAERPQKITTRRYFNQRLLDCDGRFGQSIEYLLSAQYATENAQIQGDINHYVYRRASGKNFQGERLTAGNIRNVEHMNNLLRSDKVYKVMQNIRGSPPYFQRLFYDVLAMIRQLGLPTWFLTLSAADMQWPDVIQTIARQYGTNLSDDDVKNLSFEDRSNWLRCNPATAARQFDYRLQLFFKDVLKSKAQPLGEVTDFVIRIEFQARGSPHAHTLLWVKNAPKVDVQTDEEICAFIDQHVTCSTPEDAELKELTEKVQTHKHSSYCRKRTGTCRFSFPRAPSESTLIAREPEDKDGKKNIIEKANNVLGLVHQQLLDEDTPNDISIPQLCAQAGVAEQDYNTALKVCNKGSEIVLRRQPSDKCLNQYNPMILKAWKANIDVQYIIDAYACVMYVAAYLTKDEKGMGELLRQTCKEHEDQDIKKMLRKVGTVFLNHRELSAQEAAYRILSIPMKRLSRTVVFVNTDPPSDRVAVLKTKEQLLGKDDDDFDIFQRSMLDRYAARPDSLEHLCLADFAANYATKYEADSCGDALPRVLEEDEDDQTDQIEERNKCPRKIKLNDEMGTMTKRRNEAVIRFRKINEEKEPENWSRAKLLLYLPWRSETDDLLGGFGSHREHFEAVKDRILANEAKYTEVTEAESVDAENDGFPQHVWAGIAPEAEHANRQDIQAGNVSDTELETEDLAANAELFLANAQSRSLDAVISSERGNKNILPANEYQRMMRQLNEKQLQIVMFHRDWCKRAVVAMKSGKKIEPYRVFLSGPGGVGKSHVIRLIQHETQKLLALSNTISPTDTTVLLTAPTGVAAFNINGQTLHSSLLLRVKKYGSSAEQLAADKLNTLRANLANLQLLIIDEVSMVGSNLLLDIHKRLTELKGIVDNTVLFGNVCILAVGDLYQLPPVGQANIYERTRDPTANLHGSLWKDHFMLHELDQVMRQKDDQAFAELLCRLRTNECTERDIETLKSRDCNVTDGTHPADALHVFALNKDVDEWNRTRLDGMCLAGKDKIQIKAIDGHKDSTGLIDLREVHSKSDKRSDTGGLHTILEVAVGSRIMLTYNVDTQDGLVNGVMGCVTDVKTNDKGKPITVLVKFDEPNVGKHAIATSQWKIEYPDSVPVMRIEGRYEKAGRKGAQTTRHQFPLTLAWATTIHKCQGLTVDQIVVSMKGAKRFGKGQAYVAFSRVKTLSGLFITDFDQAGIKVEDKVSTVMQEMRANAIPCNTDLTTDMRPNTDMIKVGHLNVRTFLPKVQDLTKTGTAETVDIMCFTETYLTPAYNIDHFLMTYDYAAFRLDVPSENDHRGLHGILLCAKHFLKPKELDVIKVEQLETKVVVVETREGSRLVVCALYRSPSMPIGTFLEKLETLLLLLPTNVPTVVLGDFNDNILDNPSSKCTELMLTYGFKQLVTKPTTDYGSLLDHVYFNNRLVNENSVIVKDIYFSDHDAVYLTTDIPLD